MMKSMARAVLTAAILIPGLGSAAAQAGWVGPDSWASFERRFYNWPPPEAPYQETFFSSGEGGGTRREIWLNNETRGDPPPDTWDIQSGATFSLAALTPGDPVVLSLTAIFAFGTLNPPDVGVTLFGTNGLLVESDFLDEHDSQLFMSFPFPEIIGDPPVTQAAYITSFVEEISGRYSHLGIVFSTSDEFQRGNLVDFDVRLGPTAFVPEPSSIVMGATAVLAGLAMTCRRGLRSERIR